MRCMRLARPTLREVDAVHDAEARIRRKALQEAPRRVRGAIIDDDDLEMRIGLCEQRPHAIGDDPLLVACGHADGYPGRIFLWRGGMHHMVEGSLTVRPVENKEACAEQRRAADQRPGEQW